MITTGFRAFDVLAGGLHSGRSYLLYGPNGLGKTTFALTYLFQGLANGETVMLISSQRATAVLDQAAAFGFHPEPYLRTRQLLIFEYPEDSADAAGAITDTSMRDELRGLLSWTRSRHKEQYGRPSYIRMLRGAQLESQA